MKYRKMMACFLLSAVLCSATVPAKAAEAPAVQTASLQISSYKGDTLSAGERSMVLVSPYGTSVTAASTNPAVIALEQVLGYWVMVAKAPGSATVSITDDAGNTAGMSVTVSGGEAVSAQPDTSSAAVPAGDPEDNSADVDLQANMEIRQEMIRLINEVRRENGRAELPVNEALMNAAQDVSAQCVTEHRPYDHKALIRYGWPHAGMYNLVKVNLASFPNAAEKSVDAWVKSPGHFETMLMEEASCVGTGVTIKDGDAYCYMVVGDPTGHNPYE